MSLGERYSEYDKFAWFYRKDWGAEYHLEAREAYERVVFPRLRQGDRVLDLCCGTGDLSRILFHRGYSVTGLDGSEEMLRYAREGTPAVEFLAGDARAFS